MKNEVPLEVLEEVPNITKAEFFDRVHNQDAKLVILDEFVLDVSEFMAKHPGGRFVIEHNIGRDISKFFYGGYSIDGNLKGSRPRPGVNHSNHARLIVN